MAKNANPIEALFGCVGAMLMITVLGVSGYILNGWALVKLWGWFIVPTFPSIPTLTPVQAIGISIIISYLTSEGAATEKHEDDTTGEAVVRAILMVVLKPLIVVGIGWIVSRYL